MVDVAALKDIPADWIPMRSRAGLAMIGKLVEEMGECLAVAGRIIIQQGFDGIDPETGEVNIDRLQRELADVEAMSTIIIDRLNMDVAAMDRRIDAKYEHKQKWLDYLTSLDRQNS